MYSGDRQIHRQTGRWTDNIPIMSFRYSEHHHLPPVVQSSMDMMIESAGLDVISNLSSTLILPFTSYMT